MRKFFHFMNDDSEAVVDVDHDLTNAFAKITADYSPASGEIFCSGWELLEN